MKNIKFVYKAKLLAVLLVFACQLCIISSPAFAQNSPVFKNSTLVMGYVEWDSNTNQSKVVDVTGYPDCFTSIGNDFWVKSINSRNIEPLYEVVRQADSIKIVKNQYARGKAAYVCQNKNDHQVEVKTGNAKDGTFIGKGLSCVLSISNFTKLHNNNGIGEGSASCSYNPNTGIISAQNFEQIQAINCGYTCIDESSNKVSSAVAKRYYPRGVTGTENIGKNLNCAYGTTSLYNKYSTWAITGAKYDATTGLVTKGEVGGNGGYSFSYFCNDPAKTVLRPQCSDGIDNDRDGAVDLADYSCQGNPLNRDEANPKSQCQNGNDDDNDGLTDMADPGCSTPQDDNEADRTAQCQNGKDDDNDGLIDALIELPTLNNQTLQLGGTGNPGQVRDAVKNAITAKGFNITLPNRDALVRSDGGNWVLNGSDQGYNITEHLPTLQMVCRVMGYRDYISSTCRDGERSGRYPHGKCNFHSPSDNVHWRAANGNLQVESANPKFGKTWIASITCKHKLPACSDGWDNDGDGLIDLEDSGCASANDDSEVPHDTNCSSPNDPSERDPECSDGIDNDGDAVIDLSDPGCAGNPLNDDESAATTQCQDNIDNDGDGAKDLEDYSCLGDNTKNDEANPPSECQDGVDNDGDRLIDQADPACSNNPQHNNEWSATTQCQDGIDNDSDGATDLNDYSCQGLPTNDNEALPLAECQDTVDNDRDGLTDLADPGCPTSQDNFEGDGTSQCQDGIDNDGDGATDRDDFSCQGDNTKNDESSPLSQCQDSIDNDRDGVTDMDDPGCSSPQDNNEGDGTTACQDGIDNDRDGAVDLADYSCQGNPLNRDEANPKSQCQNGNDDDNDGLTDMADPGCSTPQSMVGNI